MLIVAAKRPQCDGSQNCCTCSCVTERQAFAELCGLENLCGLASVAMQGERGVGVCGEENGGWGVTGGEGRGAGGSLN